AGPGRAAPAPGRASRQWPAGRCWWPWRLRAAGRGCAGWWQRQHRIAGAPAHGRAHEGGFRRVPRQPGRSTQGALGRCIGRTGQCTSRHPLPAGGWPAAAGDGADRLQRRQQHRGVRRWPAGGRRHHHRRARARMTALPSAAVPVPVIDIRGLRKGYAAGTQAEVIALDGVDLRVEAGEFVAIMGPSGSGKSTLMNLIGCLDTPAAGSCRCDGMDVALVDAEALARLRRDKIGFVFQGFHLLPRMSALENVAMPLSYARVPVADRERMAAEVLEAVGLGGRSGHRPNELSGGQQQRVAIARALVNRPPLLLADEPTGALDSKTGEEILALFKRLRDEGHTVVLITHDAEVAAHADRTYIIRDGELHPQEEAA